MVRFKVTKPGNGRLALVLGLDPKSVTTMTRGPKVVYFTGSCVP